MPPLPARPLARWGVVSMDHTLYTRSDADGEGADRCHGCPLNLALARERDLSRSLIQHIATLTGKDPRVIALGHGVAW